MSVDYAILSYVNHNDEHELPSPCYNLLVLNVGTSCVSHWMNVYPANRTPGFPNLGKQWSILQSIERKDEKPRFLRFGKMIRIVVVIVKQVDPASTMAHFVRQLRLNGM